MVGSPPRLTDSEERLPNSAGSAHPDREPGRCKQHQRLVMCCHGATIRTGQASLGGARRRRLMPARCDLSASRASRTARPGRVGRRGGDGSTSARATSSPSRRTAICRLRASDRSSWISSRNGRASSPSCSASRSATAELSPTRQSRSTVNSARVDALSRCWPPGPDERLAPHLAPFSRCSTTDPTSTTPHRARYDARPQPRRQSSGAYAVLLEHQLG